MAFKLFVLGLFALSSFGNVNGEVIREKQSLKCYECEHVGLGCVSYGKKIPLEETCRHKIHNGLTTDCPTSKPYCMKVTGTVMNGKYIETRRCVDQELKQLFMCDNGCKSAKEIDTNAIDTLNHYYNNYGHKYVAEIQEVCFCDTDKCNPATQLYPVYTFIIVGLLSVLFGL